MVRNDAPLRGILAFLRNTPTTRSHGRAGEPRGLGPWSAPSPLGPGSTAAPSSGSVGGSGPQRRARIVRFCCSAKRRPCMASR